MVDMNLIDNEILTQDLDYCIKAFEINNFQLMNIASNRLMENCIFLENEKVFLISAILKDIANDYMGIYQNKRKVFNSAKVIGNKTIDSIRSYFKKGIDVNGIWQAFQEFTESINEFHKDSLESGIYKENIEFTKIVFRKTLHFLDENKDDLKKISNTLINGVLGVMVRIIKNHSCSLKENMVYLFFKLLGILFPYVIEKNYPDEVINENDYNKYLKEHIDYIIKAYQKKEINVDEYNSKIWKIGKQYRELYFIYNPPQLVAKTRNIEQVPALVRVPITSKQLEEEEKK